MSTFVEECRREWRRLGVPDLIADEMASDLGADLSEAQADGVRPEEILGAAAGDPRAFAASWAHERGVVGPHAERRRPGARLVAAAAVAVLAVAAGIAVPLLTVGHSAPAVTRVAKAPAPRPVAADVPDVVGLSESQAVTALRAAGFQARVTVVRARGSTRVVGVVLSQTPAAGLLAPRGATVAVRIAVQPPPPPKVRRLLRPTQATR